MSLKPQAPERSFISKAPDDLSTGKKEAEDWNIRSEKAKLDRFQSDSKSRGWLTYWVAIVVSLWLLVVIALLIGIMYYFKQPLSDNVLIALLTTTTLNILGLPLIILKGLFPAAEASIKASKSNS